MLHRQLSSSSSSTQMQKQKPKQKQRRPSPRSPLRLRDLNVDNPISGSDSTTTCSSISSSVSVEAPRGCLRFFLSNSSASKTKTKIATPTPPPRLKSLSKTTIAPKSAPNPKHSRLLSSRSGKSLKENLINPTSHKKKPNKNPSCLYQWQQSGKKPFSETASKPKPPNGLSSKPENFKLNQNQEEKKCLSMLAGESGKPPEPQNLHHLTVHPAGTAISTPVGKLSRGPVLKCQFDVELVEEDPTAITTTTTTPPVQASVSPEIQGGVGSAAAAPVSAATPTCYGAGHHVSGVTDRRKCKSRGILTVGQIDSDTDRTNLFHNANDGLHVHGKSRVSLLPLPAEASMRWLSSPCDEDQKGDSKNSAGSSTPRSVSCPSSGHGISSIDLCNNIENSSTTSNSRRRTRITLLSPVGNVAFQGFSGTSCSQIAGNSSSVSPHATPTSCTVIVQEQRKHNRYDVAAAGENSPFSIDSLGSGNVIQTPQSDSSSGRDDDISSLNNADNPRKHQFGSEIDSLAEVLRTSLSPNTHISSIWDPAGLSYQFSNLLSPSNSFNLSHLPNAWEWDNHVSCVSNSTLDDDMSVSQSQMRISWRDGLVSRIFEMDEFDCCRCLSDDENDFSEGSIINESKPTPSNELNVDERKITIFTDGFGFPEVVGNELKAKGKGNEKNTLVGCNSWAESICIDGDGEAGGLVASGDSDWTICYKNHLFDL
ncbi:hypothetical protein NMG60_11028814 [Bertholletia excelsa]